MPLDAQEPTCTLLQGDCLDLLPGLPAQSVNAVICDLPYGTTRAAWDCPLDLDRLWSEYRRIISPKGVILLFGAQPFTTTLIGSARDWFRYVWYWEREKGTNFLSVRHQPLRVIEEVVVFAPTGSFTYNPQMIPLDKPYRHTLPIKRTAISNDFASSGQDPAERIYKEYTHAHPKNLIKFARDNANRSLVPTQKPLALMEYLIRTYTHEGDLILDNTMGSGSTGVAAMRLERRFVGMELDPSHFSIASDRIGRERPWNLS